MIYIYIQQFFDDLQILLKYVQWIRSHDYYTRLKCPKTSEWSFERTVIFIYLFFMFFFYSANQSYLKSFD